MTSTVVQGEAPESDDEIQETISRSQMPETSMKIDIDQFSKQNKPRVHIDEKLEKHWRNSGKNLISATEKRTLPIQKDTTRLRDTIDSTFESIQAASMHLHRASTTVYQLEDSMQALSQGLSTWKSPEEFNKP